MREKERVEKFLSKPHQPSTAGDEMKFLYGILGKDSRWPRSGI